MTRKRRPRRQPRPDQILVEPHRLPGLPPCCRRCRRRCWSSNSAGVCNPLHGRQRPLGPPAPEPRAEPRAQLGEHSLLPRVQLLPSQIVTVTPLLEWRVPPPAAPADASAPPAAAAPPPAGAPPDEDLIQGCCPYLPPLGLTWSREPDIKGWRIRWIEMVGCSCYM